MYSSPITRMFGQDSKYADCHWDAMSRTARVAKTSADPTRFSYVKEEKAKTGPRRNDGIMDKLSERHRLTPRAGKAQAGNRYVSLVVAFGRRLAQGPKLRQEIF